MYAAPEFTGGRPPLVLVTGAAGFIGGIVVNHLRKTGWQVRAAVRARPAAGFAGEGRYVAVGDIGPLTDWSAALQGVTHIVHAAGRAHVMNDRDEDGCVRVNVEGTRRLAEQAVAAGALRMVLLSSIKVNGESTRGVPFRATDPPMPEGAYARSKAAAEQALWTVCNAGTLQGVVLRLPLVYGPGVKANFAALVRLVERNLPLPFASIDNRRSLLGVDAAVEFIECLLLHPAAAGKVWLLADPAPLSTPELVTALAGALGRKPRLVPFPPWALRLLGALCGRSATIARLTGSLEVDASPAHEVLGFSPSARTAGTLSRTVAADPADGG